MKIFETPPYYDVDWFCCFTNQKFTQLLLRSPSETFEETWGNRNFEPSNPGRSNFPSTLLKYELSYVKKKRISMPFSSLFPSDQPSAAPPWPTSPSATRPARMSSWNYERWPSGPGSLMGIFIGILQGLHMNIRGSRFYMSVIIMMIILYNNYTIIHNNNNNKNNNNNNDI